MINFRLLKPIPKAILMALLFGILGVLTESYYGLLPTQAGAILREMAWFFDIGAFLIGMFVVLAILKRTSTELSDKNVHKVQSE